MQNLLKVPIDHFAEVNLMGFYDVVSAIGPVQVCLNNPVQDDFSGATSRPEFRLSMRHRHFRLSVNATAWTTGTWIAPTGSRLSSAR